jgi:hypothetical protein
MHGHPRYPAAFPVATSILLIGILSTLPSLGQQLSLTVTTDKSSYEYGEVIEVRSEVKNVSDASYLYIGSSSCFAMLDRFDDVVFQPICTVDEAHIRLHPGDVREDVWRLDPSTLGLPNSTGQHTIHITSEGHRDSVQIYAPKYYGGVIAIGFVDSVTEGEIQALADSLRRTAILGWGIRSEIWQIEGVAIDSLAEAMEDDPRLTVIKPYRDYPGNLWKIVTSAMLDGSRTETARLKQNFPNPFDDSTTIEYVLGVAADVRLDVFDAMGRRVRSLVAGRQLPATYRVDVKAADLADGVYLYRLTAGDQVFVGRMTVLR